MSLNHPLHVSILSFERKDGVIHLTIKFYSEDLKKALSEHSKIEKYSDNDELNLTSINKYLNEHLVVKINAQIQKMDVTSKREEEEEVWVNAVLNLKKDSIQSIEIRNTILFDLYYDQSNLMIFSMNGKDYTKKFDTRDSIYSIYF